MLLQDDSKEILGNLQVGEAVVRLQGRSVKPFMLAVPEFSIRKGTFDDRKVRHHMTRLGLIAAREHPIARLGAEEGRGGESRRGTIDNNNHDVLGGGQGGTSVVKTEKDGGSVFHDEQGRITSEWSSGEGLSESEWALLRDVQEFPEAGIAERYKRLGWSVRQGQRVKESLLTKGMIQEELRSTMRGKMRVVRPAEKGREHLADERAAVGEVA